MGYFSQRKKHERINTFLNIYLAFIAFITVLSFFKDTTNGFIFEANAYRFQFVILSFVVCAVGFFYRYFAQSFILLLFLILNIVSISSSCNLFFSSTKNIGPKISILYQKDVSDINALIDDAVKKEISFLGINNKAAVQYERSTVYPYSFFYEKSKSLIFSGIDYNRQGRIKIFSHEISTLSFPFYGKDLTLINVNLKDMRLDEQESVFRSLSHFVLNQNDSVIVFGDFGVPAWSSEFKNFLRKTGLEVKNSIILSTTEHYIDLFSPPGINVLGFKNISLTNVKILPAKYSDNHPVLFTISIK